MMRLFCDMKKINIFIQKYTFIVLQNQTETLYMNKTEHVISEFTVKFCFRGSHLLSIPYNCAFKLNSTKIIQINRKSSPLLTAVAYDCSYVW